MTMPINLQKIKCIKYWLLFLNLYNLIDENSLVKRLKTCEDKIKSFRFGNIKSSGTSLFMVINHMVSLCGNYFDISHDQVYKFI